LNIRAMILYIRIRSPNKSTFHNPLSLRRERPKGLSLLHFYPFI
jgi:hypothetical protein